MSAANDAPAAFRATRWSLVARAASPAEPAARTALDELCRLYWQPLHAFARRSSGLNDADAQDATQSFFADFLRHERFAVADPQRGKLRTFLCTAFANHLRDLQRRSAASVRGGSAVHLSIDATRDDAAPLDPADPHDAAREFDRAWALATMDAATTRLEADLAARGKAGTLTPYRAFLGLDAGGGEDYAATARALGLSEGAVRVNVCRLRKAFRAALFATIADTLDAPTEESIRAEVRALIDALGA